MSRILKSGLAVMALALFGWHCTLDHSNPLDPDNPAAKGTRTVLLEAFVNNGTGEPYVATALTALDNIREQFKDRIAIIEYHIVSTKWTDSLSTQESWARYNQYVKENFGIPDLFIDGGKYRIQGASSLENFSSRCRQAIESALLEPAYMTIEARASVEDNRLTVQGKIARLGEERSQAVVLRGFIIENMNFAGHHQVERQLLTPISIGTLNPGNIKNFTFSATLARHLNLERCEIVLFAQDDWSQNVYQAIKVSL